MASSSSFHFTRDEISPKLLGAHIRARAYISKMTTYYALQAETYAKNNAAWTDRTANARTGLVAIGDNSQAATGHWHIDIGHSVNYGIWLETRFAGRYAIIVPTMEVIGPQYVRDAGRLYNEMFGV